MKRCLLLLGFLLCMSATVHAIPAFVQTANPNVACAVGSGTTLNCTFASAVTTGNIFIFGTATTNSVSITGVSPASGSITCSGLSGAPFQEGTAGNFGQIEVCSVTTGGFTTFTTTWGAETAGADVYPAEYSGVSTVQDGAALQVGGGGASPSGTMTIASTNELIFAIGGNASSTVFTAGTNLTLRGTAAGTLLEIEDWVNPPTGAQTVSITGTNSNTGMIAVALKAPAAGGAAGSVITNSVATGTVIK